MELHDVGWKNCIFTLDGVYMLGYGCGVSQYFQFYDQDLENDQLLQRPYLGNV